MNINDINDALGEATTPRRRRPTEYYEGPTNLNGEPDTTSIAGIVGTMVYRSDPLYSHYTGQWVNGLFEGNGTVIYRDGDVYTGQFLNGVPSGNGRIIYKTGEHSSYTGQILNGHLVNGELIYKNGDVYTGQFLNQLMHGKGTRVYIHNRDAEPHRRQTETYHGEFRNGRRSGNGTSTRRNMFGDVMDAKTGIFENDKFVSHSTLRFNPKFEPSIPLPRGASRAGKRRRMKTVNRRRLKRKSSK